MTVNREELEYKLATLSKALLVANASLALAHSEMFQMADYLEDVLNDLPGYDVSLPEPLNYLLAGLLDNDFESSCDNVYETLWSLRYLKDYVEDALSDDQMLDAFTQEANYAHK